MSAHWHDDEYEPFCDCDEVCGMRKPGGTTTCVEPAGHAGSDGKGESHGDGSVIRWIYR